MKDNKKMTATPVIIIKISMIGFRFCIPIKKMENNKIPVKETSENK